MVHYGVTKAAILAVSSGLTESVAGTGVAVNAFIPGPTKMEEHIAFQALSTVRTPEQLEYDIFITAYFNL